MNTMGKRSGLGRNLSALLGQSEAVTLKPQETQSILKLPVTTLQPGAFQPRRDFDEAALSELADSIKKQGLLQPLLVRAIANNRYEIIAGERRWRACQMIGMTEIPVLLREVDDETAMAMALVENLQREDLNAMDQARAMHRLTTDFGLTHQQIAELLAKSRTAVSNFLRLMNLSEPVKRFVEHGDLDMGHARCLLVLDEAQQYEAAKLIVAKNLSVRETESLVNRLKKGSQPLKAMEGADRITAQYQETIQHLSQQLKTKIQIKPNKSGRGHLVIHYDSAEALERMIHHLMD